MNNWKRDIIDAISDFEKVTSAAKIEVSTDDYQLEPLSDVHIQPKLPKGRAAVYGFWGDGEWLKIGHAGPKTAARYESQHYNPDSNGSTFAKSLLRHHQVSEIDGFTPENPKKWILASTHRFNVLFKHDENHNSDRLRKLLEAFLIARLEPRYEGRSA